MLKFNTEFFKIRLGYLEMTQKDAALLAGLEPSAVSHWIKGRRFPSPEALDAIAKVLGVDDARRFLVDK